MGPSANIQHIWTNPNFVRFVIEVSGFFTNICLLIKKQKQIYFNDINKFWYVVIATLLLNPSNERI